MFNFFKNWRKKGQKASYGEVEKLITSSLFTPMKPTQSFTVSLKERLLNTFAPQEPSPFFKKVRAVLGTVFAAVIVLAVGGFLYFQKPLFGPSELPIVRAGATSVPVNFPIRFKFPYDVPLETLQKHFTITPQAEGIVSFENGIVVFDHPKFLNYDTEYEIKVDKDATSLLEKNFLLSFKTLPRFQTELYLYSRIDVAHVTMNFYDPEPQVALHLPYAGAYTAKAYKVSPDELINYVTVAEKNFFDGDDNKNEELLAGLKKNLVDTKEIQVKGRQEYSTETAAYKPNLTEAGTYLVELTGIKHSEYDEGIYRFFLTFSRYAVSSKRLGDKLVTWFVNTKSSKGVSGVALKALDNKKEVVFQGKTDESGLHRETINLQDFEKQPQLFVFEAPDETVVQMIRVRYRSIFEGDFANPFKTHRGFIMFDRPLYTPGDSVKFKVMLRKNGEPNYDGSVKTARVEVKRETYGAPTQNVFDREYPVSDMGTFAGDFKLGKELQTGQYTMFVKIGETVVSNGYFGVEVFQKPEFEVSVKTDKDTYLSGDTVKVDVSANYFFGTPVKNAKVEVDILGSYYYEGNVVSKLTGNLDANGHFTTTFNDVRVHNPSYYGYWMSRGIPYTVKARVTEDTGKTMSKSAIVDFYASEYRAEIESPKPLWNLKPREKIPFVFRVRNNFSKDENNEVANAEVDLQITRRKWNRKEHKQDEWTVVEKTLRADSFGKAQFDFEFTEGGSYDLKYTATDTKGNLAEHRDYIWIPDGEHGIYYDESQSLSTVQIMLVPDKENYRVGETARVSAFLPQEEGDVFLSANTADMRKVWTEKLEGTEKVFEVPITPDLAPGFILFAEVYHGDNFFTGSRLIEVSGKKLTVEVSSSTKQLYPKEQVTLSVTTKDEQGNPVATESAVSVIDKAILALRSFSDISLFDTFYPKPSEYAMRRFTSMDPVALGGAEMGGCFLRGTRVLMADGSTKPIEEIVAGDEILTKVNEYSSELGKDRVVRTFKHTVGEYLVINGWLKVTPVHRMFVNGQWKTAADIRFGDWLIDSENRRIEVTSIEKVESLVEVYNFETALYHTYFADGVYVHNDKGGGDTRPRTDFVDTAYWNAFVETGSDGKGEVSFDLPDNLTTWVALGKSITRDTKVGEGEGEFIVTKDLFIRPMLPLFVRGNDELDLLSVIHNNTAQAMKVKALIKADGATVTNDTLQELDVAANSVSQVTWKLKVHNEKFLKLAFSVNQIGGNFVDNLEHKLPIYSPLTLNHEVFTGVSPTLLQFSFSKGKNAASFANAKVTLNASVVSMLPKIIEDLTGYPYGCVEQTMSKHLPNLIAKKHAKLLGITLPDDIDEKLNDGLDRLQKFQHEDGSFGWWEGDEANLWMTGYVLEGMVEMKELGGLTGNESMYTRTLEYLKGKLPQLKGDERIYAAYVLSRALPAEFKVKFDEEELKILQPELLGYAALTHHFNGNGDEAKRIVQDYILKQLKDNHWEQSGTERDGHDLSMADKYLATGVNLSALLTIGGAEEAQIKGIVAWLMNHRTGYQGLWGSTRQSSQVLFALLKYIQKFDEFDPDLEYTLNLNGKEFSKGKVRDEKFSKQIEIPVDELTKKNSFELSYEGKGSLYYTLDVKQYADAADIASGTNDVKIARAYLKDGASANEFSVGDVITVELAVTTTQNDLTYVMVEDMLPSGFDVINDRLERRDDYYGGYGEFGGGYYWNDPVDVRDERVTLFDQYFYGDRRVFTYRVRAARKGTYAAPAPRVEPMYEPQLFAVGSQDIVTVK